MNLFESVHLEKDVAVDLPVPSIDLKHAGKQLSNLRVPLAQQTIGHLTWQKKLQSP